MKIRSRVQKTIMDINDVVQVLTWYQRTSSSSVTPTAPIFKWYGDTQPTKGMVANDYWYNTTDDSLYVYSGGSWNKDTSVAMRWSLTEPPYSTQNTYYLYTVQQSLFGDESCLWGEVTLSSSYEAAKAAYNIANNANSEEQTIYIQAVSGTNSMSGTTTWVVETGESTSSDTPGLTPKWTTKRPTYRSNYPVLFVATQRKSVSGVVTCSTPLKDDTTTVIDGGHITTGTIDASQVNVTNIDADNISTGTIDASQITVTNIDASEITVGAIKANQLDTVDINASHSLTVGAINTSDSTTASAILNSELTSDIDDASKVATNYLTFNTQSGLDVGYSNTLAKTSITGSGVEIFDQTGNSAASFGSTARIGKTTNSHIEFSSNAAMFYDYTNNIVGEMAYGSVSGSSPLYNDILFDIGTTTIMSVPLQYYDDSNNSLTITPFFFEGDYYSGDIVESPDYYSPNSIVVNRRNTEYRVTIGVPLIPGPSYHQIYTFSLDDNNVLTITTYHQSETAELQWSAMLHLSYNVIIPNPYYRFGRLNAVETNPVGSLGFETGYMCWAKGNKSFASGDNTQAWGNSSAVFGRRTIANKDNQLVCGEYNVPDDTAEFIVGDGEAENEFRSNAFVVKANGGGVVVKDDISCGGSISCTGNINVTGDITCTGTINDSAIPEDVYYTLQVTQVDDRSLSANGGADIGFTAPSSTYVSNGVTYNLVSTTPINIQCTNATNSGSGSTYIIVSQGRPGGCYLRNVGSSTAKVKVITYYLYKKARNQ